MGLLDCEEMVKTAKLQEETSEEEKEVQTVQMESALDTLMNEFRTVPAGELRKVLAETKWNVEIATGRLRQERGMPTGSKDYWLPQGTDVPMEQSELPEEGNNQIGENSTVIEQSPMETEQKIDEEKKSQATKAKKPLL